MVIDSSAIVAIFLNEPECSFFQEQIFAAQVKLISAVSVVETGMVLETRLGAIAVRDFRRYIERLGIEVTAVHRDLTWGALAAWRKYGKGRHPAKLNLGDCFSYALAKSSGEPLLCKGGDFARTDLKLCPQTSAPQ
jgi:ribonuclease VapC